MSQARKIQSVAKLANNLTFELKIDFETAYIFRSADITSVNLTAYRHEIEMEIGRQIENYAIAVGWMVSRRGVFFLSPSQIKIRNEEKEMCVDIDVSCSGGLDWREDVKQRWQQKEVAEKEAEQLIKCVDRVKQEAIEVIEKWMVDD